MLYVVLFLAVVFYATLFMLWGVIEPHLAGPTAVLSSWHDIVVTLPDHTALLALREMIVMTMIYLTIDGALSIMRRSLARRRLGPSYHDYPKVSDLENSDEFWE